MAFLRSSTSDPSDAVRRRVSAKSVFRVALCLLIAVPVLFVLAGMVREMDRQLIHDAIVNMPGMAIAASGLLTVLSFLAVARYDDMAIRILGFDVSKRRAIGGGFIATSLSQSLGFGFFVGSVTRWRCYRDLGIGLPQAAMISGVVIAGFMTGFAVILSAMAAVMPMGLATLTGFDEFAVRSTATLVLLGAAVFLTLSVLAPRLHIAGRQISLPPAKVLTTQVYLAALDVVPAAMALWVLIPGEVAPAIMVFIPVYLAALGLGLASNAPGGIGVLELTCLTALPFVPPEQLLAALIVHRAIYFGLPVVVALILLVVRELGASDTEPGPAAIAPARDPAPILADSTRAEASLAWLGDKEFIFSPCGRAFVMATAGQNAFVAVSDPIGPEAAWPGVARAFREAARRRFLAPIFYRVSSTFSEILARAGIGADQIGMEARVDLTQYTTQGPQKRELRRKLKQADKAGVTLQFHAVGQVPLSRFRAVSAEWARSKGGERGFSMGYFVAEYINRFAAIEARIGNKSVGFLTIWWSGAGQEAGLDVMRLTDDAPDGTMHALTDAAIAHAAAEGAAWFSLASVPFAGITTPQSLLEAAVKYVHDKRPDMHGSAGLYRFKNAFRPVWEPRFVAAPGAMSMALGLLDTARLVNAPMQDQQFAAEDDEDTAVLA